MSVDSSVQRGVVRAGSAYKQLLWGMMGWFGIDESLWGKIMAAVGLQFLAGLSLAASVAVLQGTAAVVVTVGLFVLAVVAFFNTALIVRDDLIRPLRQLESSSEAVAAGSLDTDPPEIRQHDEIGSLSDSFGRMFETLQVTARQADALASESFDDPVLDRSVPGEFGDSLDRMADNLSGAISDLEARSTRLTRLIEEFEAASDRASDGDLRVRLPDETIDGRFGNVVDSYNRQLDAVETAIARAKPFADDVATASEAARWNVSEVSETIETNAKEVETIADDAIRQSEMLDSLARDAETLSATVEEIAASSNELSEITSETATSAADGADAADTATDALYTAAEIANETDEAVSRLVERSEAIREIVEFIDEVASRTNLLALNASIEAARADTETAGFEVVAEEVKSLAEETHESAGEIEELIDEIDEETHTVASDVARLNDHIEDAVATVDNVTEEFNAIAEDTARVDESASEICSATDQQAKVASEVSIAVDDLAAIGDTTAERAESVATTAIDGSEQLREATESVTRLAEQADRLTASLRTFEVSETSSKEVELQPAD